MISLFYMFLQWVFLGSEVHDLDGYFLCGCFGRENTVFTLDSLLFWIFQSTVLRASVGQPACEWCVSLITIVFCTVAFCLESFSFPSGIWVILHPHSYFTHCPIGLLFSSQRWTPSWICLSCIEPKDNMCQNSFSAIVFSPDHPHAPFVTVKYCQWDFFFPVFRKSSMGTRSSLLGIF